MNRSAVVFVSAILFVGVVPPCDAQELERIGSFRYLPRIDGITDSDRSVVYTSVRSVETQVVGHVAWRCRAGHVEAFLRSSETLGNDPVEVHWRVDRRDAPPATRWLASISGMAVFAPQDEAKRLTEEALTAADLLVRVVDPAGVEHDFHFDMEGARTAIGGLACVDTS